MGIFKKFHNYILHCSSLSAKLVFSVLKDSFFGSNSWQLQIEKKGFQTKSLGCCVSILLVFQNGPSNLQQAFPKKNHRYHFPWIEKPLPHTHPRKTSIFNSKNGWFGWMFRLFPERTTSTSQRPRNAWCSFRSRRSDRSIQEVFAKKCCEGLCFLWGISLKIVDNYKYKLHEVLKVGIFLMTSLFFLMRFFLRGWMLDFRLTEDS